ncbi:MAG: HAMP domain-containing sensor histidine kinase [Solirubrobacteraceae bacterium]
MSWTTFAVVAAALGVAASGVLAVALRRLARANALLAERNRELENAASARVRFVSSMSHELRTPLNAVIGFAELLDAQRAGPLSKAQREHLGIIRASAAHLLTLADDVLDLASIDAGHVRIEIEPVQPGRIAEHCVTSLRPLFQERGVQVELEVAELGAVALDPARLRQVMLNYLSNAIRFTEPGGRVTVRLAHEAGGVRLEVSDTGIGIAPEDQERVFDEFVQVGRRAPDGSGLGLAITKEIVQAQGGRVGVRSQPGLGSTFYAWLPAGSLGAVPDRVPPASPRRRRPEKTRRVGTLTASHR